MKHYHITDEPQQSRWQKKMDAQCKRGRVWTGIFLLLVGSVALARSFGMPVPNWLFSWQALLILVGIFTGLKHGFNNFKWLVPILIGLLFMANDYFFQGELKRHIWPAIILALGILFIVKPKRRREQSHTGEQYYPLKEASNSFLAEEETFTQDDYIDATNIFSGTKKNILSKNFKGGDLVNIFGGTEINFSQADLKGRAIIEVTAIFGGSTLVVPSNWAVSSEAVIIFGGIQDRRNPSTTHESLEKVLLIKGTVIFGGIEIKSY